MDTSYLDWMLAQEEAGPAVEPAEGRADGQTGGIWVVADVEEGRVAAVTLEALGMARGLADALGAYVHGVLLGEGVTELAPIMFQAGANSVWVADDAVLAYDASLSQFTVEPYLGLLGSLLTEVDPEVVVFGATPQGQALAPRLAQRMGGGLIEHATEIELDESSRTVQASVAVFGGEYFQIIACPGARPQFVTLEPGALPEPFLDPYRDGEPTIIEIADGSPAERIVTPATGYEPTPTPLAQAPVIIAAGRDAGDFDLVRRLASVLGGEIAGDRGARDAGWIGRDQIVDVRGVRVEPRAYVAVGIRGDTFHNAAVGKADFILAIHPDPEAPIFQVADVCIAADPREILPVMLEALE